MAHDKPPLTVVGAMLANLVIAVAKFWVAIISGSSAMLAEGIHSVVDTGNQGLLLIGSKRSKCPPDEQHPFGYGKELYFWGLIVAILLFSIGGGVSLYEGVHRLTHPAKSEAGHWTYLVLAIAFVAEGISLFIAVRAVSQERTRGSFWTKFQRSKDPTTFLVVAEDAAALAGIVVAFTGVGLSELTGSHYPDGIATIVIGTILCCVAVYLVYESKHLLIGESADRQVVASIRQMALAHPTIREVGPPATMHLAPQEVVLNLDLRFDPSLNSEAVARTVDELESSIRREFPEMKHIFVEAQLFSREKGEPQA